MANKNSSLREDGDAELFYNSEDREFLLSLPEVEREKILFQRHEERKNERERIEIEKKLSRVESSSSDSADPPPAQDWDAGSPWGGSPSPSQWGVAQDSPPSDDTCSFGTFRPLVLGRDFLVSIIYGERLKMISGFFIRLRTNEGYKIFRIREVRTGERYRVSPVSEKFSDKWFIIENNGKTQPIGVGSVSGEPAREEEYEEYKERGGLLSEKEAEKMSSLLRKEIARPLTEDEVGLIVKEKRKFNERGGIAVKRKVELMNNLNRAREAKDARRIEKLEEEIREISKRDEGVEDAWRESGRERGRRIWRGGKEREKEDLERDGESLFDPFVRRRTRN